MTEEYGGFASARARLEEIAAQASAKDTPLEKAIELLEEGARIAHRCTELLDHTEWRSAIEEGEGEAAAGDERADDDVSASDEAAGGDAARNTEEAGDDGADEAEETEEAAGESGAG